MEKRYLKYSLEDLLEDKQFIKWVLKKSNNAEWERFIDENPEIAVRIKHAKEIILLFRDSYEVMDEESLLKIWENIDTYEQQHNRKIRQIKIRRQLSRAALVILLLSVGILGYNIKTRHKTYEFSAAEKVSDVNEAKLILAGGNEISLKAKNSSISLNTEKKQININDSIINIPEVAVDSDEISMNEVVIPFGKKSELLLADGTKVWLNAGSRLAFPTAFKQKNREVYLEGEAYFEVAKNAQQPFVVHAAEVDIKVLGTHFDISAYPEDNQIKTVLIEGRVEVSTTNFLGLDDNKILLKPNQIADFNKTENSFNVTEDQDVGFYIAWTYGWMEFHHENLNSVFNKLERYYNVKIKVPGSFPSSELISGKLDMKESLEDVLKILEDVADIDYRIIENKVYIDKKITKIQKE